MLGGLSFHGAAVFCSSSFSGCPAFHWFVHGQGSCVSHMAWAAGSERCKTLWHEYGSQRQTKVEEVGKQVFQQRAPVEVLEKEVQCFQGRRALSSVQKDKEIYSCGTRL